MEIRIDHIAPISTQHNSALLFRLPGGAPTIYDQRVLYNDDGSSEAGIYNFTRQFSFVLPIYY